MHEHETSNVRLSFRLRPSTCVCARAESIRGSTRIGVIIIIIIVIIVGFSTRVCARAYSPSPSLFPFPLTLSLSLSWRGNKKFQRVNGIATAGQSALTMFYCYVTDRVGCTRTRKRRTDRRALKLIITVCR